MAFLDGDPDMTGTHFAQGDLDRAREVLVSVVETLDPAWLAKPTGPLALQWNSNGVYPACYLIHVAQVLHTLLNNNVTVKSVSVLHEKIRDLLRPPKRARAFEELLTELELAASLAHRASPISFEPLVPEEQHEGGDNKPRSPDYGVRLPDGDVCFEVTNIHFGFLDDWDAAAAAVTDRLSAQILVRQLRREVHFTAPVGSSRLDLASLASSSVLADIEATETGGLTIAMPSGEASVRWRLVPHFGLDSSGMPAFGNDPSADFSAATVGGAPGPVASVLHTPLVSGEKPEEAVVTSIRNTLKGKRRQMTAALPYVLVVRIAQHRIPGEAVSHIIHNRLLPNPEYAWLTGIALFQPGRNWETGSVPESLMLHVNDNARYPASPSLLSVFDGSAQFHL